MIDDWEKRHLNCCQFIGHMGDHSNNGETRRALYRPIMYASVRTANAYDNGNNALIFFGNLCV